MIKKIFMTVVATLACAALAGCGMNNNDSHVVDILPGMSIVATGNQGTLSLDADNIDPFADVVVKVGDSVAAKYGVQLESNQEIVSAKEGEAIVVTALDGYKFSTQYTENTATLVKNDYSESYRIYDCTGSLNIDVLKEHYEIKDLGNGFYLQTDSGIKGFWIKDNVSVTILYTNNTNSATDIEKVTANMISIIDTFKICK